MTLKPSTQAKYGDLFHRLSDSTWIIDSESFLILEQNEACEHVLKFPLNATMNTSFLRIVHPEDQVSTEKALRVARRRYYPRTSEARLLTQDGSYIWSQISCCMLTLDSQKEVLQIIAKDVTQQKKAEYQAQVYLSELKKLNTQLQALSSTDEMTQLPNFRNFKEKLVLEHKRCQENHFFYSIAFFDVDHFKKYNDRNGHPAGDDVLRGVAQILMHTCDTGDLPARYGGEEFVVLMPGADLPLALEKAERMRKKIESHPFAFREFQPLGFVSVSIGVSSFDGRRINPATAEEILHNADQALYQSKNSGRNKVSYFDSTKNKKVA